MSNFTRNLVLALVGSSLLAVPAVADTEVRGSIFVSTTWRLTDSPFLVKGDITVHNQARLTIEPGVIVKVAATDELGSNLDTTRVEIIVEGELVADGTEAQRVRFIPASGTAVSSWYGIRVRPNARDVSITRADITGANIGVTTESPFLLTLRNVAFASMNTAAKYVGVQPNAVFDSNTVTGATAAAPTLVVSATTASSFTVTNSSLAGGTIGIEVTNASDQAYVLNVRDSTIGGNVNVSSTSALAMVVNFDRVQVNTGGIRITTTTGAATANLNTTTVDRAAREGIYTGTNVTANIDRCTVRAAEQQGVVVNWGGRISNTAIHFCERDGLLIAKDASQSLVVTNNTILYNGALVTTDAGIRVTAGSDAAGKPFLIQNTILIKHPYFGLHVCPTCAPVVRNNDVWSNGTNYSGITPDVASVSVNPLFVGGLRDDLTGGFLTSCTPDQMRPYTQAKTAQCAKAATCDTSAYCSNPYPYCGCQYSYYPKIRASCTNSATVNRQFPDSLLPWHYYVASVANTYCSGNTQTTTGWKSATGNSTGLQVNGTASGATCSCSGDSSCKVEVTKVADGGCPVRLNLGSSLDYNLALASYSSLIDAGVNTDAPATDHDGAPRPFDGNFDGNPKTDIGAWEFGPTGIRIEPSSTTMRQGDTVALAVVGLDSQGNPFPISGATWSVTSPAVGWITQAGAFTAKDQLGTFPDVVRVQYGSMQALATITVTCRCTYDEACTALPACFLAGTCTLDNFCILDNLRITPAEASVPIQQTQQFAAAGYDGFGNRVALGPVVWEVVNGGGEIDHTGLFIAHFTSGSYPNTVRATSGGKTAHATVHVLPGQLTAVQVTPDAAQVTVGQTQQFRAVGFDDQGNAVPNVIFEWVVEHGGGTVSTDGLFTAGCVPGLFTETVVARFGVVSGRADVTVVPGNATSLQVIPPTVTLAGGRSAPFAAVGFDTCGNEVPITSTWSVVAGGGVINASSGVFTAGCVVGEFANTVKAMFGTLEARASVTVTAGAAFTLVVEPARLALGALANGAFTARGFDACGVEVPVSPIWSVESGGGTIGPETGLFQAGCDLGLFQDTVLAVFGEASARASVEVGPGAAATASLAPQSPSVKAGGNVTFTATAQDACGNPVSGAPAWSTTAGGTIDSAGLYTAGCAPGPYPASVVASFGSLQAKTGVTVLAGDLATIDVTPRDTTIDVQAAAAFQAAGKDACGNPMTVTATWSVVNGGGTINSTSGAFTAGTTAGTFTDTVRASSAGINGHATVRVRGGAVTGLAIVPASATLQPGAEVVFTAKASDAFGNAWDVTPQWSVASGGGTIADDGRFTATIVAGTYTDTVRATFGGFTARATVVINPTAVTRISVSPDPATVTAGGLTQFTASAFDAFDNPVGTAVVWSVVAGGGAIDAAGKFTAGTVAGTFTNTVRATAGLVHGSASVTVQAGPLATLSVAPTSTSVAVGQPVTFTATGTDAWGNPVTVTPGWSVTNGGGVISGAGVFTAGTTAGIFANTVRAQQGDVAGTASVTVTPGPVASVQVTPADATLAPGVATLFSAACLDAHGNVAPGSVSWTVVGGGGTIDSTGLFTAGTVTGSYSNTVRATCASRSGFASVTVVPGSLATLAVSPSSADIVAGGQATFHATGLDAYGNPVDVQPTWSVVVGGGTISPTGVFTAGIVAGTFPGTVRATQGSVTGSASVTVTAGPLAALLVSPEDATVQIGTTRTFTARGVDAHGNDVALIQPVDWSVVAGGGTIGVSTGVFKPGCTPGTFPNTVRAASGGTTGTATVAVVPGDLVEIQVLPEEATPAVGGQVSFTATGYDACGNELDVQPVWSADPDCGRITARGTFTAGTRAGNFPECVVASLDTIEGTAEVTVLPGPAATITVAPAEAALVAGAQQQFTATAADAWGNAASVTPAWSVVSGGGTIASNGVFTAGTAVGLYPNTVRASEGTVAGTASVRVMAEAVASVVVTPDVATVQPGATAAFAAVCLDRFGNTTAATAEWSVVNGGGTVSPTGVFTAGTKSGTFQVRAACGAFSDVATVTVTAGPLAILSVAPTSATLAPGAEVVFTATGADVHGNAVAVAPTWSVVGTAGTIHASSGLFKAGTKAGTYVGAVRASVEGVTANADVTVVAGTLAALQVLPASAVVAVRDALQFQVTGTDMYGNSVVVDQAVYWNVVAGGGSIGTTTGLFTAGCLPGTYTGTVQAASGAATGTATVVVVAGTAIDLEVQPPSAEVAVDGQVTFSAVASDACGNSLDVTPTWSLVAGGGTLTAWGRFTAGHAAGRFENTVKAAMGSLVATATVVVRPGAAAQLAVVPAEVRLRPGATQAFTATAADSYGNTVTPTVTWSIGAGGGSITAAGVFTAATQAGTFTDTVVATMDGLSARATVTIEPGDLDRLVVDPAQASLVVRGTQRFTASGFDVHGNAVAAEAQWAVVNGGGTVSPDGLFSAGAVAGAFADTVQATAAGKLAYASVTVLPGPVASIEVEPLRTVLLPGTHRAFKASGRDAHGNPTALLPAWSVVGGGGTIDEEGLFTAGQEIGEYANTVQAASDEVTGTATVEVVAGPLSCESADDCPDGWECNDAEVCFDPDGPATEPGAEPAGDEGLTEAEPAEEAETDVMATDDGSPEVGPDADVLEDGELAAPDVTGDEGEPQPETAGDEGEPQPDTTGDEGEPQPDTTGDEGEPQPETAGDEGEPQPETAGDEGRPDPGQDTTTVADVLEGDSDSGADVSGLDQGGGSDIVLSPPSSNGCATGPRGATGFPGAPLLLFVTAVGWLVLSARRNSRRVHRR